MNLYTIDPTKHTAEDVCRFVFRKLIEQGTASIGLSTEGRVSCLYRSPAGACAIGHLIPDDQYTDDLEESLPLSGNDLLEVLSVPYHKLKTEAGDQVPLQWLLAYLQSVHDSYYDPISKTSSAVITRESLKDHLNTGAGDGALHETFEASGQEWFVKQGWSESLVSTPNVTLASVLAVIAARALETL